jgi:hypothetical protein
MESSHHLSSVNLATLNGAGMTSRTDLAGPKFLLDEIQSQHEAKKILVEEKNAPSEIFEE